MLAFFFIICHLSHSAVISTSPFSYVAGKIWYFNGVGGDFIKLELSKPDTKGDGTFLWITGKEIIDKHQGTFHLKGNILWLHYHWAGAKIFTKTYRIEHETKTGFLLIEIQDKTNEIKKSFLFTNTTP